MRHNFNHCDTFFIGVLILGPAARSKPAHLIIPFAIVSYSKPINTSTTGTARSCLAAQRMIPKSRWNVSVWPTILQGHQHHRHPRGSIPIHTTDPVADSAISWDHALWSSWYARVSYIRATRGPFEVILPCRMTLPMRRQLLERHPPWTRRLLLQSTAIQSPHMASRYKTLGIREPRK